MDPTSRPIPRYVRWADPDSAPPLPPKKGNPAKSLQEERPVDAALPSGRVPATRHIRSYSFGGSTSFTSRSGDDFPDVDDYPPEPRFIFGDSQGATVPRGLHEDAKAVEEAVADPSNWLLRNRHTGQELEAKAFVQSLMQYTARRPQKQAPPMAGWIGRRHRNNGHVLGARPRPTLLPPSNGTVLVDYTNGDPLTPPGLILPSKARSKSPAGGRGKSSLLACPPHVRSSSSTARTSSGASSTLVGPGDADVFRLNNIITAQILPNLHPGGIRAISFSPSADFLATAGADHRCFVFRVCGHLGRGRTALEEESFDGQTSTTTEGGGLSTGDKDEGVAPAPRRLVEDDPVRILHGHVGEIVCVSWSPDSSALLTASADGTVRCWHPLDGGNCTRAYEHGGRVTAVAWDPSSTSSAAQEGGAAGGGAGRGQRFLTGCMDAKLRLFSVDDPEAEESVLADKPVTAVSFAPDGKTFVAGFVGGGVGFYRTDGLVQLAATECRRHGIRHTATQHALQVASPVRRLSSTVGGPTSSCGPTGRARNRERHRRSTTGGAAGRRSPIGAEERVTGLCFRPQRKTLSELANGWGFKPERDDDDNIPDGSVDALCGQIGRPAGLAENREGSPQERAPYTGSEGGEPAPGANGVDPKAWAGPTADVLVSTNNSRTRVLVAGSGGTVTVGAKLKGHNTDGILGRHAMARFSEDGELVISGSTDGNVHVWPSPDADSGAKPSSRRGHSRPSWKEGHERAQVCEKSVAVPVALFAPDAVARSMSGGSSRVIVTGDDDGCLKVFVGERRGNC